MLDLDNMSISVLVDLLGQNKAIAAEAIAENKQIEKHLDILGVNKAHGDLFDYTRSEYQRKTIDRKGILNMYDIPQRVINQYTNVAMVVKRTINSRKQRVA